MRRVVAIAWLAVRAAVRSRVVAVLLVLLVGAIVGLPLTVKSDGTPAGEVQVRLTYTLGAVGMILMVATWWAGCAAVAVELQEKQAQVLLTKPVRRAELWWGKWLGLVGLVGVLLAISGAVIYAMLQWQLGQLSLSEAQRAELAEQVLVARRGVRPVPVEVRAAAREELERRRQAGELPVGQPVDQVLQAIEEAMLRAAFTVPPGFKRRWEFELPVAVRGPRPVVVRYRFESAAGRGEMMRGVWLAGPAEGTLEWSVERWSAAGGEHAVQVPAEVFGGARRVAIEYANVHREPVAVTFDPKEGLELMMYAGTFEGNLVRGLVVWWVRLALLGAVTVSAGSLVSLPVAALVSGYAMLLAAAAESVGEMARDPAVFEVAERGWLERGVEAVVGAMLWVQKVAVQPLRGPSVLEALAEGRVVGLETVAWTVVIYGVVYGGLCAVGAAFLLNRREVALASA
ncbi:MAG: hypothetical protein RMM51_04145 [Verrucomicrobiae bacterium]|nr:hypothetical protein [Verrucomicrobiae bacterium]